MFSQTTSVRAMRDTGLPIGSEALQTVLERSPAIICAVDDRVRYWSSGAERLYGWRADEAIGRDVDQLLGTRSIAARHTVREALGRCGVWQGELTQLHKNGCELAIAGHWLLYREAGGRAVVMQVNEEITARRHAEHVQLHYAAIVESAQYAIIATDLNGLVTSWNKSAEALYGYSAEEMIGTPITVLLPPDRGGVQMFLLRNIASGGRVEDFETERVRKDGVRFPVSLTISPICDASGRIVGASKISRDISKRRQAEVQLAATQRETRELLAILETVLASAPVGFAFVDRDCRYLRVNDAMAAMNGLPAAEHIGRTVREVLPHLWPELEPIYRSILDDNGGPSIAREARRPDPNAPGRELEVLVSHYPVRIEDELIGIGVIILDMTDKRRAERRLMQAQRMEAIGKLTGGMAHDFNNLLGVIILNLDLAYDLARDRTELASMVDEALEAAWHGSDLITRLLAFARRQPLQPMWLDVNDLVSGTVRLMRRLIGKDIEVTLNLGQAVWPALADPAQLEASLTNLVTNARDAMPAGGKLVFATANRRLDADYARAQPNVTPGEYVMIEISDTGCGMPPEIADQIFEPFFTTKEPGKGSGLGLSMVFGFLQQSGGHVNVYSEVGVGTTFRLYLPRAAEAGQLRREPAGERAVLPGGGETVLVVEDNAAVRRVVLRQLRGLGYRVFEARSGSIALELIEAEDIDLLFTDVVMPGGLDGFELARMAVERNPDLKVLLTSGFPEARLRADIGSASNFRLLSKPYPREDLARAIREVLSSQDQPR